MYGRSAVIRTNDRGPFSYYRISDLVLEVASELVLKASGIARVKLEVLP